MRLRVADNPERGRVEVFADERFAGFTDYYQNGDVLTLPHTEVEERWQGSGVAGSLVRHVLNEARRRHLAVVPLCPYVRGYIAQHLEFLDLVPAERRVEFGLPSVPGTGQGE
jgi:predicted GNAT family acetyltransferase